MTNSSLIGPISALKKVTASLDFLTDRDVTYWGGEIRIDAGDHSQAIHTVRIARQAVSEARAALASLQLEDVATASLAARSALTADKSEAET